MMNQITNSNCFCQAQSQLQVKLSLKAELALISVNPATPPPPGKVYLEANMNLAKLRLTKLPYIPNNISNKSDKLYAFNMGRVW